MRSESHRVPIAWMMLVACIASAMPARAELKADQLLLVANKNLPESYALARHYAQARHVPDGRILAIALPVAAEQISFASYQHDVVPVIRDYLKNNHLEQQVTCLVTFYGMPLRIGSWQEGDQSSKELAEIQHSMTLLPEQVVPQVEALEHFAQEQVPTFHPDTITPPISGTPDDAANARMNQLHLRMQAAWHVVADKLATSTGAARDELLRGAQGVINPLLGKMVVMQERIKEAQDAPPSDEQGRNAISDAAKETTALRMQMVAYQHDIDDAGIRARMRQLVHDNFSPFDYIHLLQAQAFTLHDHSVSAFDNELALLWWDRYQHASWQPNPLRADGQIVIGAPPAQLSQPGIMVMRLDAPSPELVRQMIDTSIKVEEHGLQGQVVIDTLAKAARDPSGNSDAYGAFDELLRLEAQLLKTKTRLKLTVDEKPELLPAFSQKDVALYCGWYSPHKYVACCQFNEGAVAYHVASFTMISLHNPGAEGWCANLLHDNCVATLGPVAEPFLHAFPQPNEFFPLLLTGKLTLAEVFWKTSPTASWMITMVGDPLYTPYKTNPQMKVEDLPQNLQDLINGVAATRPAHS